MHFTKYEYFCTTIYENILYSSMGVNGSEQCIEFARE